MSDNSDNTISAPRCAESFVDCVSSDRVVCAEKKSFFGYLKKLFGLCSDKNDSVSPIKCCSVNKAVEEISSETSATVVEEQLTVSSSPEYVVDNLAPEHVEIEESVKVPADSDEAVVVAVAVCEEASVAVAVAVAECDESVADSVCDESVADTDCEESSVADAVCEEESDHEEAVADCDETVADCDETVVADCDKESDVAVCDEAVELPSASVLEPEPRPQKKRRNLRK